MSYAMSKAEREQFLAQPHVGVLSVVDDGAPLTVPVWYGYEPGGHVTVITGRDSRKARAVRAARWLSLCAQDEAPPYKYVTVSGPVAVSGLTSMADLRVMAARYLGDAGADEYMESISASSVDEHLVMKMTPRNWLTIDYGKPG